MDGKHAIVNELYTSRSKHFVVKQYKCSVKIVVLSGIIHDSEFLVSTKISSGILNSNKKT